MDNFLDLTEIDEVLADDIRELYEYDKNMSDEFAPVPEIDVSELCLKIIKHRSWEAEDILEDTYNELSKYIFEELEYDFDEAEKIYNKLQEIDKDDANETIQVLKEFDKFSCFFAEKEIYPMVMINSLSIIFSLTISPDNKEVFEAAAYVVSHYKSFWPAYVCEELVKDKDPKIFTKMGFASREDIDIKELIKKYFG